MIDIQVWRQRIHEQVGRVFLGRPEVIDWSLTALLAEGHVLLEDLPGVGKTLLARSLAAVLGGSFRRIQCTPDLMPADIVGFSLFNPATGQFEDRPGPLHSHILLVDEINRASPRTQSALLEAMGEGQLTREGKTEALPDPFFVLATENPIEFEGTFPLPEAQKDRFLLSFSLGYPSRDQEEKILTDEAAGRVKPEQLAAVTSMAEVLELRRQLDKVHVDGKILTYLLDLAAATRRDSSLSLGLSTRGAKLWHRACRALALLRGRSFVVPADVKELFLPVVSKRVSLKPSVQIRGVGLGEVLAGLLASVPVPEVRELT